MMHRSAEGSATLAAQFKSAERKTQRLWSAPGAAMNASPKSSTTPSAIPQRATLSYLLTVYPVFTFLSIGFTMIPKIQHYAPAKPILFVGFI